MNSPAKMQTVGEATSSVTNVFKSTFSSLATSLNLPQLRDSFYQNIIYILIVIIILVGIMVYIQMVGTTHINPLNLPPSKEIKKIQIQKVVEGFDMEQNGGIEEFASNINTVEAADGGSGNLYSSAYDGAYDGAYEQQYGNVHGGNDMTELTTDLFDIDEPKDSRRRSQS
jgi:hypothetical protein